MGPTTVPGTTTRTAADLSVTTLTRAAVGLGSMVEICVGRMRGAAQWMRIAWGPMFVMRWEGAGEGLAERTRAALH